MGNPGETNPWEPPQRPDTDWGEDGRGREGGDKNPPTARNTREKPTDGGDSAARRGATATQDAETEMAEGADGAGHLPTHFTGADAATT